VKRTECGRAQAEQCAAFALRALEQEPLFSHLRRTLCLPPVPRAGPPPSRSAPRAALGAAGNLPCKVDARGAPRRAEGGAARARKRAGGGDGPYARRGAAHAARCGRQGAGRQVRNGDTRVASEQAGQVAYCTGGMHKGRACHPCSTPLGLLALGQPLLHALGQALHPRMTLPRFCPASIPTGMILPAVTSSCPVHASPRARRTAAGVWTPCTVWWPRPTAPTPRPGFYSTCGNQVAVQSARLWGADERPSLRVCKPKVLMLLWSRLEHAVASALVCNRPPLNLPSLRCYLTRSSPPAGHGARSRLNSSRAHPFSPLPLHTGALASRVGRRAPPALLTASRPRRALLLAQPPLPNLPLLTGVLVWRASSPPLVATC
jgi:hypothetical protein